MKIQTRKTSTSRKAATADSIVQSSPDQVSCDLGSEAAVLNLKDGLYYGLNPVGARVWNLIGQPRSLASIRDAIVAEFDVAPEACERDLADLIDHLLAKGLVRLHGPEAE